MEVFFKMYVSEVNPARELRYLHRYFGQTGDSRVRSLAVKLEAYFAILGKQKYITGEVNLLFCYEWTTKKSIFPPNLGTYPS
jgi:hypothetical protein